MKKPLLKKTFLFLMLASAGFVVRSGVTHWRNRMPKSISNQKSHSEWFNINRCRIHVRAVTEAGHDRIPVVLVHGLGVSSAYFLPVMRYLASHFTVYAPDLPGHGLSDTPARAFTIQAFAQVLKEWMDHAGIERAALIGQSMGCQIAVEAATRYPERITRLVLIGPVVDPSASTLLQQFGRLVAAGLHERLGLYKQVVKDYLRMGRRILPELHFMMTYPIAKKLAIVKVPALLVRGENDALVPENWFNDAACLVKAERVVQIPDGGHAVQHSMPRQLANAITPFLTEAKRDYLP